MTVPGLVAGRVPRCATRSGEFVRALPEVPRRPGRGWAAVVAFADFARPRQMAGGGDGLGRVVVWLDDCRRADDNVECPRPGTRTASSGSSTISSMARWRALRSSRARRSRPVDPGRRGPASRGHRSGRTTAHQDPAANQGSTLSHTETVPPTSRPRRPPTHTRIPTNDLSAPHEALGRIDRPMNDQRSGSQTGSRPSRAFPGPDRNPYGNVTRNGSCRLVSSCPHATDAPALRFAPVGLPPSVSRLLRVGVKAAGERAAHRDDGTVCGKMRHGRDRNRDRIGMRCAMKSLPPPCETPRPTTRAMT